MYWRALIQRFDLIRKTATKNALIHWRPCVNVLAKTAYFCVNSLAQTSIPYTITSKQAIFGQPRRSAILSHKRTYPSLASSLAPRGKRVA